MNNNIQELFIVLIRAIADLTPAEFRTLKHVVKTPGITSSEIAERTGVTVKTVRNIISGSGLLRKAHVPEKGGARMRRKSRTESKIEREKREREENEYHP